MDRAAGRAPGQAHVLEPHWSRKRAGAVAVERVTLHGVPIVVGRNVDLGRIDLELARELSLRHALVEGDWDSQHAFFAANCALLDDVEELETRARRRDLVVDEDTLFAFYDARVPAEAVSGRHFDTWWKRERRRHLTLDLTAEFLTTEAAKDLDTSAYPDAVEAGGLTLPLSYAFEPGQETDGITVDVLVAALHQVDPTPFTWQVPRAARRPGHGADQDAAQAPAAAVRARTGPRPSRARPAAGPRNP